MAGAISHVQAARADHRLDRGAVGDPPVRRVVGQAILDKCHLRPAGLFHHRASADVEVGGHVGHLLARKAKGLEDQQPADLLRDEVERQQRVAQVIKTPRKRTRS